MKIVFIYRLLFILCLFVIPVSAFGQLQRPTLDYDASIRFMTEKPLQDVAGISVLRLAPGEEYDYRMVVKNHGPTATDSLFLQTIIPADIEVLSLSPAGSHSGDTLSFQLEAIVPNDSVEIAVTARAPQTLESWPHFFTTTAHFQAEEDTNPLNNADSLMALVEQPPILTDVRIQLSSATDSSIIDYGQPINAVLPGEEFHYTVQLVNLGANSAESIVVAQILPPEVSYLQSTLVPTDSSDNQLVWKLTGLDAAATMTWDIDVRLDPDVPAATDELISSASFACPNDTSDINNRSTETIRIIRARQEFVDVGVQIVVQADTFVERSGVVYPAVTNNHPHFYDINVHNNGPAAAESVRLTYTNTMPGVLTSVSQDPPADGVIGDTLYWIIPRLAGRETIRVNASGALEGPGAVLSSVRVIAVNDTSAANDTDAVAVWFLEQDRPAANYDLEIDYNVLADSTIQIGETLYKASRFDDGFGYFIWIRNNGPATAHAIEVQNSLPNELTLSQFSHAPHSATDNTYVWQIDSLIAGGAWTAYYNAVVHEGVGDYPFQLTANALVSADSDTLPDNNSKEAIVYILGDPPVFADLATHQSIAADSFERTEAGLHPLMLQGAASEVTLLVSNNSTITAENVCITYVVDDSFAIIGAHPSPDFYAADSVAWCLSAIEAGQTREFIVEISLAEIMPVQRNLLHNILAVTADNEDPASLDDNQAILTMVNYGIAVEPFAPLIEVSPAIATVSDSLWIRVQFPVAIVEWDLRVHLPNGDIRTDFADQFIARTAVEPGVWYDIDEPFLHRTLLGSGTADEVAFEVQALGRFGSRGSVRSQVVVNVEFDLLPPNVVFPDNEVIAIDFVVSTGHVEMQLYDVAGRHIATLADDYYQAGRYTLMWNGMENGQLIGSGVYLITLRTKDANTWKKMIIVR
ncbi:hypothetical protein JXA02_13420 [candidate division KSB1 bacterium]|nr:hypothetical protein [candidate division KSB1 bacterium]